MKNKGLNFLFKSILAGAAISMGGTIYLKTGGVAGAILFAIGLIAVVVLGLNLFTGKAQFVWNPRDYSLTGEGNYPWLLAILVGNILGCMLMASIITTPELQEAAEALVTKRLATGALKCGALAIGCGFLMTLAVQGTAQKNWLPLLFGIPGFIICGFPHCVADAFYVSACSSTFLLENATELTAFYAAIVVGNFLGCNAYRLVNPAAVLPSFRKSRLPLENAVED